VSQISGTRRTVRNLSDRVKELDAQSLAQQEHVYAAEFQIQQMERKVRAWVTACLGLGGGHFTHGCIVTACALPRRRSREHGVKCRTRSARCWRPASGS